MVHSTGTIGILLWYVCTVKLKSIFELKRLNWYCREYNQSWAFEKARKIHLQIFGLCQVLKLSRWYLIRDWNRFELIKHVLSSRNHLTERPGYCLPLFTVVEIGSVLVLSHCQNYFKRDNQLNLRTWIFFLALTTPIT